MGTGKRTVNPLKFAPETYSRFSLNDLILASIYLVLSKNETCTFERLVAECFYSFPKVFCFKRYPEWPDSLKFDRPLRNLRAKGLIVGSPKDKFSLNRYGETRAIDIIKKLKKGVAPKGRKVTRSATRSADDRIIEYIKNTPAFMRYLNKPKSLSITDQEFRNLLRCTLETPDRVLKQNLIYYLKLAEEYKENEIKKFLLLCKKIYFKGGSYAKGSSN